MIRRAASAKTNNRGKKTANSPRDTGMPPMKAAAQISVNSTSTARTTLVYSSGEDPMSERS